MKENVLFYTSPASVWTEAMPLGNGMLGMMVYGGTDSETIQLNEETLWSGYPFDHDSPETAAHLDEMRSLIFAGDYNAAQKLCEKYLVCRGIGSRGSKAAYGSYQTAGELKISQNITDTSDYKRELDIRSGVVHVYFGGNKRTYFASYNYNVTVTKIEGSTDGADISFVRENSDIIYEGDTIIISGYLPLKFCTLVKTVRSENEIIIYTTTATSYKNDEDPYEICLERIARAMRDGYNKIYADHVEYFNEKIDRVKINIGGDISRCDIPTNERIKNPEGDKKLIELYFMFGRYLLISSSRGMLPANLQGIWTDKYQEVWSADYHININIQMNYWLADVCGLPEFAEPYYRYIASLVPSGEKTARTAYNCGGWVAHTITNPWGFTSLGEHPSWGSFMCAGAWCALDLWQHYLYTLDTDFLKKYYPVIRGAAQFFCDFLVRDPNNGYMVTCPSNSPENSYFDPATREATSITAGPTMDNTILRCLFEVIGKCSKILGVDSDFAERTAELESQLPPLKIGKYGQIMEWQIDFDETDPGHRHMSNLFGLHPECVITNSKTPDLFRAARMTIDRRLANGGGHTGWSRAWVINFLARLGDGDAANINIKALISHSTLPNMFDTHPPFQIDGNFGGTAGIAEMLIQSHEEFINIIPALPYEWKDGSFEGFTARGGYTVSAKWTDGNVTSCSIKSKDGRADIPAKVKINGNIYDFQGQFDYNC